MDAPAVNPDTLAALQQRRTDLITALTNINATLTMVNANAETMTDVQYEKRRADLINQKADIEQELATLKQQIKACNILKSAQDKRAADERKVAGAQTNLANLQRAVSKGHARPSELAAARAAAPAVPSSDSEVRDVLVAYVGSPDPALTGKSLPTIELVKIAIARAAKYDEFVAKGILPLANLRPEVRAFAMAMEERLEENDHKGGWDKSRPSYLFKRLTQESAELRTEALRPKKTPIHVANVLKEAADVANFAMMLADVCGAIVKK